MTHKTVASVEHAPPAHWVGDGFHVRPLFAGKAFTPAVSPFLMLDYAAPVNFPPRPGNPPGVGPHPHRGFETVTIVYQGEIEHRDSAGHSGKIGAGDVQWMTAARGVVHDEFHSKEQSAKGGLVSMVQLWVNLPAKDKMSNPRYQTLLAADIPTVALGEDGTLRVIAGEFAGHKGPAMTFSPVSVWDVRLNVGGATEIPFARGHRSMIPVLDGEVRIGGRSFKAGDVVFLSEDGDAVALEATREAKLLVLTGEPINEPIAHYGPFVMNTQAELRQAVEDFRAGRMGDLAA